MRTTANIFAAVGFVLLAEGTTHAATAAPEPAAESSESNDENLDEAMTESSGEDAAAEPTVLPMPPDVEKLIQHLEKQALQIRGEGIQLLKDYLRTSHKGPETAEALFKLAELIWEDAQAGYLESMGAYQAAVELCHTDRSACKKVPRQRPKVDLTPAQDVYRQLIRDYPRFRKIDTVIYLYAFSLREQDKGDEAVRYFYKILKEYPASRFRADAWMALGEYRFYERQDHVGALKAYENVAKFPSSQLHGLALFKSAWCYWKMGNGDMAAQRFKDVLDLTERARERGAEERKRAAELQDQALDYLVELFTEDDTKSARDAFDFMVQIGGKAYSTRVLKRLAETVFDQTRYERAAEAYLFLLNLDPMGKDAPEYQIRVVESFQSLESHDRAAAEMRKLAINYGPKSDWAKANKDRPKTVAAARDRAAEFIRTHAKMLHANAQRNEKESKTVDKAMFAQAADAYGFYLEQFEGSPDAAELTYYRADILFFKLQDFRKAGDAYISVARTKPVGQFHKDALLQAMGSFERLRPPAPKSSADKKNRKVTEDDRKFAEAADLYAEILPDDKDIITVIYKNGLFFYDYGEYDEAVKRFGLILERYPDNPLAADAGDHILRSFSEASDYENIEHWARRLKKSKAFATPVEQARLDNLIVGSMTKSAEALVEKKEFENAATRFHRVAEEYPKHTSAPVALLNAGAAFEKAGRPQSAVDSYREIAKRFPGAAQAPAALFTAAQLEESVADYASAADIYEQISHSYPKFERSSVALKNAGLLRQSLGQYDRAAAHYAAYEKRNRAASDARDVAFQRGIMMEEKKDHKQAISVFGEFVKNYPNDDHAIEAMVRQARAQMALRSDNRANESLEQALAAYKKQKGSRIAALYAAEARYLQGQIKFRDYERVTVSGGPKQLARTLENKANLLDEAKKIYLDVVEFKVPEWATAALFQIGRGYATFAQTIRDTQVPKQLSEDEQIVYREELDKSVIVIEDKALNAYRTGYSKAIEIGVYNEYTKRLRQALAELDSGTFPPEVEIRMGPRQGEAELRLMPIEEIRRD
jgi:cellulose synthase operon protein C